MSILSTTRTTGFQFKKWKLHSKLFHGHILWSSFVFWNYFQVRGKEKSEKSKANIIQRTPEKVSIICQCIVQGITVLKASIQIKCEQVFKKKHSWCDFFFFFLYFAAVVVCTLFTGVQIAHECVLSDSRCAEANRKLTSCISRSNRGMRMHGGKSFMWVKECKRILPSQTKYEKKARKAGTTMTRRDRSDERAARQYARDV